VGKVAAVESRDSGADSSGVSLEDSVADHVVCRGDMNGATMPIRDVVYEPGMSCRCREGANKRQWPSGALPLASSFTCPEFPVPSQSSPFDFPAHTALDSLATSFHHAIT